jgi:hypothetical protein
MDKMIVSGAENARPIKMIDIETKEVTVFKSIAYAVRTTKVPEYSIRQGLSPLAKKRFEVNGRTVVFRIHKP